MSPYLTPWNIRQSNAQMLSTRNTFGKVDSEHSTNNQPKKFVPGGFNDSRGYQHISYNKKESSFDWKRLWAILLYFGAFILSLLCLWDLMAPTTANLNSVSITNAGVTSNVDAKLSLRKESFESSSIHSEISQELELSEKEQQMTDISKESSSLYLESQSQSMNSTGERNLIPDSIGCYHNIPEYDTGRHIVAPPAGPVKLVCCQSTKGTAQLIAESHVSSLGFSLLCCSTSKFSNI